nr:hypothetical protein [Chloroflexota bacterium]
GLGELAVVALDSGGGEIEGVRVEVYPTFQHDQPIVEVYCRVPEECIRYLEAGVYDVYVQVYLISRYQQAWREGVTILEGEVKEITQQFE